MSRYPGSEYRPQRSSLRDAPPLSNYERSRAPFRERDYERQRSPPRNFNPSSGSSYPDNSFAPPPFRGGFSRGRGRGDYDYRGSRVIRHERERELFRPRERSPNPPPRHNPRRNDDDRRPDWPDRERELDRGRREPPPPSRADSRSLSDVASNINVAHPTSATSSINPDRLAILESTGADAVTRRPSSSQAPPPPLRELRRDIPLETPAYLNGRAFPRGSSPPTQAPPVPAFSFSVAPAATSFAQAQTSKPPTEPKPPPVNESVPVPETKPSSENKPIPPANAPTAPKAATPIPKAHLSSPLLSAPKAPRALENDSNVPAPNRLQGVRSLESLSGINQGNIPTTRPDLNNQITTIPQSPGNNRQAFPQLSQPISPNLPQGPRFGELAAAPTGPRAIRAPPPQASVSPRPPFASSPRSDIGSFLPASAPTRAQTPPPSAPSGPRRQSFSVSPRATHSNVPTAPRGTRAPPIAPRVVSTAFSAQNRPPPDRPANAPPPTAPSGPRNPQWNQWRRPGGVGFNEKPTPTVPAKRDLNGDEKERIAQVDPSSSDRRNSGTDTILKSEDHDSSRMSDGVRRQSFGRSYDRMELDQDRQYIKPVPSDGHSAAQSFFGKQLDEAEDDIDSSSEDDELDEDEDATLLEAKHARKERELRSRMIDLSAREYRATTPLESIARLARISIQDVQRLNEREHDIDMDDRPAGPRLDIPPALSSDSDEAPDVITPTGDEAKIVAIRDQDEAHDDRRRLLRRISETISLPFLVKAEAVVPFEDYDSFHEDEKLLQASEHDVMTALHEELQTAAEAYDDVEANFHVLYRQWREECEEMDKIREEQERLERQQSQEPVPEVEGPTLITGNPIIEGRRIHKYSSEYDVEQVLKQSEETARIEREMLEREAKKIQADMEKEAWLPDQLLEDIVKQQTFTDVNGLREPETLTLVFSYEPPANDFTDIEQSIFVAAFKDTPKKWGEIASLLPERSYKDCIHHYYANKWDGRFRDNRAKKLKGGRRGRGGKSNRPTRGSALMADLNRGEDLIIAPNVSDSGRPKRAAAPTTFGEKDPEQKAAIMGASPAKKMGQSKSEAVSEAGSDGRVKRQKRTGEKPGRKAKSHLTAIAAAPVSLSDGKPIVQIAQTKEEITQAQELEHASLLAGFHNGNSMPYNRVNFTTEVLLPQSGSAEDQERPKPTAAAKPSASSYWSGPERTDFLKYIAYFGTDFGAIAAHMGTKTQIMIKNHYQRQIDGGGRPDLEASANLANDRRERGDDIGAPPTPTPIVKRKYDNPQTTTPRPLAPQTETMEMDDLNSSKIASSSKHASPSQFQPKPRFVPAVTTTPIQTQSSPVPTTAVPVPATLTAGPHARSVQGQHTLGSPFYSSESHFEPRSSMQKTQTLRGGLEASTMPPTRNPLLHTQSNRTPANDADYMSNLRQEQIKAQRLQAEHAPADQQPDSRYRQHPLQYPPSHGLQTSHNAPIPVTDRAQLPMDDKPPTPPRSQFSMAGSSLTRPLFQGSASALSQPLLPSRNVYNPSPPKHDISRPPSVMGTAHTHAPTPAPEPPKKSNILSILNSESEEPRPVPKHDPVTAAPTRTASPAYPSSASQVGPGISSTRREPFGQPQAHYPRGPYTQSSGANGAPPPLKQEPLSANSSKPPDWASQVLSLSNTPSPLERPMQYEREPVHRSYLSRPHMMNNLMPRNNASPPPLAMTSHSRASSLTGTAPGAPSRERAMMGGMQQTAPAMHPNPFAPPSSYGQDHRPHHAPMADNLPLHRRVHHGNPSNPEELGRSHHGRERSEAEYRMHLDRHHPREAEIQVQARQHEYERTRQQGPPPALARAPLQAQSMGSSNFGQYALDMQERRRMEQDNERRRYQDVSHQHGPQAHSYMHGERDAQSHGHYRIRPDDQQYSQGGPFAPAPRR